MSTQALLDAARGGDQDAFGRLVDDHRGELQAHCYRMLGSIPDAEDALQETLLRAWRALPQFEGRSSLRSWLYAIATNACLKAIERRPARVLPVDYGPAADPHDGPAEPLLESVWVEPYPDDLLGLEDSLAIPEARYEQREAVELAFIASLQHLPARQRAVLILRDVLGFSAGEVASMLDTSADAVYSTLQRAHKSVDERLPEHSQQETLRALGDDDVRRIVERFVDAWEHSDVDAVVAMLAEDAMMEMPPIPTWYRGRDEIADFLRGWPMSVQGRFRMLPTRANAQPAFASYVWDGDAGQFRPHGITVLTLRGDRISEFTSFLAPELPQRFGLPGVYPGSPGTSK